MEGKEITIASKALTAQFGKGYGETTLRNYRKFHLTFKHLLIQQPLLAKFGNDELQRQQRIFVAKYLTYLPSKEEPAREIERQKKIFSHKASKLMANRNNII